MSIQVVPPPTILGRFATVAAALGLLLPVFVIAQTAPTGTTTPAGRTAKDEAVQLTTFTITEDKSVGYESMQTTSGLRTVQELKNVANSISIMNAQFMEDLGLTTMEEMATWFVSGDADPNPNSTVQSRVILRGMPNSYAMRNGWIWYSPMDVYSTERVEVLRGPNAFLYGEADIGGAQNQITKRGLFTRNLTKAKLVIGSHDLQRAELDVNRRLNDKLAVRLAAVTHKNDSWIDNVRRDFRGVYGAVTYRPFPATTISMMGEHNKTTAVFAQGLFTDGFSRAAIGTVALTGGYIFVPKTKSMFRGQGRIISTGSSTTIVDPSVVRKTLQSSGPLATYKDYTDSFTVDLAHHVGKNLHLQITGNFYQMRWENWGQGRGVVRDRNPLLPDGTPNPYFNELYTEYARTKTLSGNIVRDMRFSAIYDINPFRWMRQQLIVNVQQHQDNPGQKKPKYGEYLDMANPNWVGAVNPAMTQAAFLANRTTFANNRIVRRYYLKDGVGPEQTADREPIPGVSAWYPDLASGVPATGNMIDRRFYTPSVGVGASGTYFKDHLFTMIGYRRDAFNMKTTYGAVRPQKEWVNDYLESLNPNPFVNFKVDGANYGGILRFNDMFAIGYNYAQSFRLSDGLGAITYVVGEVQTVKVGEGQDISARVTLFGGRLEMALVHYKNFTPNARFSPAPAITVRDEIATLFPARFNSSGTGDYQTTTSTGDELEATANLTRNWRLIVNYATNKVVNVDRAPLLKSFQAAAKDEKKATPLLDDFLLTIPEGLPNPGYTKARANFFSHYTFSEGSLKGFSIGAGANWRLRTYRGTVNFSGITTGPNASPIISMYSPAYTVFTLTSGYRTKIANRPTSFTVNIDNLTNKEYYRSTAIGSGAWGDPRGFKLTMITEF